MSNLFELLANPYTIPIQKLHINVIKAALEETHQLFDLNCLIKFIGLYFCTLSIFSKVVVSITSVKILELFATIQFPAIWILNCKNTEFIVSMLGFKFSQTTLFYHNYDIDYSLQIIVYFSVQLSFIHNTYVQEPHT